MREGKREGVGGKRQGERFDILLDALKLLFSSWFTYRVEVHCSFSSELCVCFSLIMITPPSQLSTVSLTRGRRKRERE